MIQPLFNGMLAILLANWALNELPHAAGLLGNPNSELPTTGQLRYIAVLCQQLKMTVTYEEQVRTFGEAGRMIRELEAERAHRRGWKRLKSGSPGSFRVERTTVDKVIDDLERTWHRIESDMSTRMQSALGILKEVMGYYYEEPCVVVWDDSNLVGIAVYETYFDKDRGIQDTHIKELASFTHKPGVGRLLIEEVTRIGREEGSDIVSASYGPGAKGFYEGLGFVKGVYYPEEPTLMMYRLKSGNPGIATPVVGFTGTRRGMTPSQKAEVRSTLASLQPRLVRHGDCIGADAEFHAISRELGIPVWLHPCTLSEQRAYSQGAIGSELPKEPLERNRDIVNTSDILLAAPGESIEVLRSGTWSTIRYARKTGRKLLVVYPEGRVER